VIHLWAAGPPGATVDVAEEVDAGFEPIATAVLGPFGFADLHRAALWRCDRRSRRFVAAVRGDAFARATFAVRTPSCRDRLSLTLPRHVLPGRRIRARVSDEWGIGGVTAQLCARPPGRRARCISRALSEQSTSTTLSFEARRRGRWRIDLRAPRQHLTRRVDVSRSFSFRLDDLRLARVLLTGDSMMQTLDSALSDRLRGRAQIRSDVRVAMGISKPGFDWVAEARSQAASVRPDATVVFVGGNDGFDMTTPYGARVACCDEAWIGEYARRVAEMMRAYSRAGAGRILWLTLPAPRDPERKLAMVAVNEAVRGAARGGTGVILLELDQIFTPGFAYRDFMRVKGRLMRVRAVDGVHLSVPGSAFAASLVGQILRSQDLLVH
jgi:hypothetical protein